MEKMDIITDHKVFNFKCPNLSSQQVKAVGDTQNFDIYMLIYVLHISGCDNLG